MKNSLVLTIAAVLCALSALVVAQVKPEDAVEYRRGILHAMGWNVGPMGAMVQGKIPFDKQRFAFLAERTAVLAPMPWEGFTPDTKGEKSDAKPALWENMDDFRKRAKDIQASTAKLAEVAAGGDEDAMKQQFGETVKVCKGCHDEYRVKH